MCKFLYIIYIAGIQEDVYTAYIWFHCCKWVVEHVSLSELASVSNCALPCSDVLVTVRVV